MLNRRVFILIIGVLAVHGSYCQSDPVQEKDRMGKLLQTTDSTIGKYTASAEKKIKAINNIKDSIHATFEKLPKKFFDQVDKKVEKYTGRVNRKTIKTLTKLSKWEEKIKSTLQKLSPETATKLFGNNQLTFTSLLDKIKKGESIQLEYRQHYDKYRDNLTTGVKYFEQHSDLLDKETVQKVQQTKQKLQELNNEADSTQALQQFIKERKKQLISSAVQYMGKSKYLTKMNKEVWYYAETVKNYKEIFKDEAKTEKLVKDVLNKVPGFQKFTRQNSMLAGIFGAQGDVAGSASYEGLQTRAGVQQLIQQRLASGGPGAQEIFNQNMKQAQAQLNTYKDKILKSATGKGSGDGVLPDFKPNMQKAKTFLQRLQFGTNIQFARNNTLTPTTMDLALTAGYKLNDKSIVGIGAGYKMGLGTLDKIRFTTQGINLRSFVDWKLKKQFYLSGGWEMNYLSAPATVTLTPLNNWQQSALLGVSKKLNLKTKWTKQTQLQLLYDFMAKKNVSQQWLFRVGYSF